ncbi:hypothetical protein [Flavobacterium coralii]|uniref:hypothetical protein n=1 Tax=Flavobacterium coralii TaxID=2838017 RepID=UPI000C510D0B|nr:hypothetical protein [Flavobacterium sp.]|tara:strand:- start:16173 stop:16664 length:492 start_codon:yes stop_codon:yes gene_type:complete
MTDILNKISSYNLFNNLLPGILFVILCDYFVGYDLSQENLVIGIFLYYFIGLTISRISSILIEPILKKVNFIKFTNYADFISAQKNDNKIDVLVEVSNKFRSILTMIIVLIAFKFYTSLEYNREISESTEKYFVLILLAIIYLLSFKKQIKYITKRIDTNKKL